jgi:ethanolamine ammonia-lyase large subunit
MRMMRRHSALSAHLTVGGLRDWLLSPQSDAAALAALAPGMMPEMRQCAN